MEQKPVRILIADDHQMFIDGIKAMLDDEGSVQFVAEANDGISALHLLDNYEVDLVITDISMPGMSGTELAVAIKEKYPAIKILVLTMYNDLEIIREIFQSEVEGYILKNTSRQELVEAIHHISNGGTFFSGAVVDLMMQEKDRLARKPKNPHALTKREIQILQMICDEKSTLDIAAELFLSPRTVETHRKNIIRKTGCKTIVALIKYAYRNNLADLAK